LIGARHGNNCALLVNRVLGLRARDQLKAVDSTQVENESWRGCSFSDGEGGSWTQLRIPALLADENFLDITTT
jgi:twitching motility protein PilI